MKLRIEGSAHGSGREVVLVLTLDKGEEASTGGRDTPLRVEFDLPRNILPRAFRDAALRAAEDPPLEIVGGGELVRVRGGAGTWTAWILSPGANEKIVTIMLANDLDASSRAKLGPAQRGVMDDEHPAVELHVALELDGAYDVELTHRAGDRYFEADDIWVEYRSDEALTLYLTPGEEDAPAEPPVVSLRASVEAPTALPLGETVYLVWSVERCKGATLAGPFAEGHEIQVLDLGPQQRAARGRIAITVLSRMTVSLKATVEGPEFDIEVIRHLFLDTLDTHKRCAMRIEPATVLPSGGSRVYWYVSNVHDAQLRISNRSTVELVASGGLQCDRGYVDVHAWGADTNSKKLDLTIEYNLSKGKYGSLDAKVSILPWLPIEGSFPEAAQPHVDNPNDNCLVHSGHGRVHELVYATARGIWYGTTRPERPNAVEFEALDLGRCRALCPADSGFVLLLSPSPGRWQLAWFRPGRPLETWDCPAGVDALVGRGPGRYVRLLRIGTRVYLYLSRAALGDCFATGAWSCDLDARKWTPEPYLRALFGFELAYCADRILAFRRTSGELVRLDPSSEGGGTLSEPRLCARAPHPLTRGVALAVGELLVFLGSDHREDELPADPVYDLKTNSWRHCGRHREGVRAAAYSGGTNKRLWAIHDDGPVTLAVGSTPSVFWRDYGSRPEMVPVLDEALFTHDAELSVGNGSPHPFAAWDGRVPAAAIVADAPMIIDEASYTALAPEQSCTIRIHHGSGTPTLGLSWRPQLLAELGYRVTAKLRPGQPSELECAPEGGRVPGVTGGARWTGDRAGAATFTGPRALVQVSAFNPLRAAAKVALVDRGPHGPSSAAAGSIGPRQLASYRIFDRGDGCEQELRFELPGMEYYWHAGSSRDSVWVGTPMYDGQRAWESRAAAFREAYATKRPEALRQYAEPPTVSKLVFEPSKGLRPAEGRFYHVGAVDRRNPGRARILGAEIEDEGAALPRGMAGAVHQALTLAPRPFVVQDRTTLSTGRQRGFMSPAASYWVSLALDFHVEGFTDRIVEPQEAVVLTHGQIYREAKLIVDIEWCAALERSTTHDIDGDIEHLLEPTLVIGEDEPARNPLQRPGRRQTAPEGGMFRRRYEITGIDEHTAPDERTGFLGLAPRKTYASGGLRVRPVTLSYMLEPDPNRGAEPTQARLRVTLTPQLRFDSRDLELKLRRVQYAHQPFRTDKIPEVSWAREPGTARPHEPAWVYDRNGRQTREWVLTIDARGELGVEELDEPEAFVEPS